MVLFGATEMYEATPAPAADLPAVPIPDADAQPAPAGCECLLDVALPAGAPIRTPGRSDR